jgi:hypothetical protein
MFPRPIPSLNSQSSDIILYIDVFGNIKNYIIIQKLNILYFVFCIYKK